MRTTVHARVADMKTEVILCCADLPFSRMLTLELERLHLGVRHYAMLPDRLQELMRRAGLLIVDAELSDAHLSDALALADRAALPVILFGWQLAAPQNTVSGQDRVVLMRRPFLMERFLLAVRSAFSAQIESDVFRRESVKEQPSPVERLRFDTEEKSRAVFFDEDAILLTQREYDLLRFLWQNRGKPQSRETLLHAVWRDKKEDPGLVAVYIRYLRAKIDDVYGVHLICSVRGQGYLIHNS